jgi:hypothetical protein
VTVRREHTVLSVRRIADLEPAELAAVKALGESWGGQHQSRRPELDIWSETVRVYHLASPDGRGELCVAPVNPEIAVGVIVQQCGSRARQAQYAVEGVVTRAVAPERLEVVKTADGC